MKGLPSVITVFALAFAHCLPAEAQDAGVPVPSVEDDGTIGVPPFTLPYSSFASPEARAAFVRRLRAPVPVIRDIHETRRLSDEKLAPQLDAIRKMFPTTSVKTKVGSVPIETFIPEGGVAPGNEGRVLIEVHGGGFVAGGGGLTGALSSIPIASVGRIKVVSVDYRLAPEHHFPAASEDLEVVYREILKTYRPEAIGIFGCSAGGMLAGEAIPWFLEKDLPLPGAIGVFCASLHTFAEGDSAQIWPRLGSVLRVLPPPKPDGTFGRTMPYFAGASPTDPLAVPAASRDVLSQFPPTLFLTGTRAPEMSGAAQSHLELRELGRTSELLLFDGMDHGFFSDPNLPESQRAYRLIANFFLRHLGK